MQPAGKNSEISPEAALLAIFTQAFAGQTLDLPRGASAATLRRALALNDKTIRRLFEQARSRSRPAAIRRDRRAITAILSIVVLGAGTGAAILARYLATPPLATSQLYAAAVNDKIAFAALSQRAKKGDAAAQFDLATLSDSHLLRQETVVAKNDVTAVQWYQAAANLGFAPAENNLGFAYHTGQGVARNNALAAKWYLLAAETGLANAENSLGFMYQNGLGVNQDERQALGWTQKAAAQHFAEAENSLGVDYQNGLGIKQNLPLAAAWFQRAAVQGEPNAENSLGVLYYRGHGVTPDDKQAFNWFALAAAKNIAPAQLNLGLLYASGAGVAQDNVIATKWFLLAQERGDSQAKAALNLINPPLTSAQLSAAQAAAEAWDKAQ